MMIRKIFYGSFFLLVSIILSVSLWKPYNNLIPGRMLVYTLIWVAFILMIRIFFDVIEKSLAKKINNIEKVSKICFRIVFCLFGIALYVVSLEFRTDPITDYEYIYDAAQALAQGQSVENWYYFAKYPYNLGTVSLLAICIKGGLLLGMKDPYYFVLAVNVLQVMLVMWAIFYLAGLVRKDSYGFRWTALILFLCWTPVWAYTSAFYSDQLSFGGSIIGMALFYLGCQNRAFKKWIFILIAGILWGLSAMAKVTAWIPFVALVITFLLHLKKKALWKETLILSGILLFMGCGSEFLQQQFPSAELEAQYGMPMEYEIVIGLLGDGTYGQQEEFVESCLVKESLSARQEYCRQIIRDNWRNFFDTQHMAAKIRVIFGSGEISPTALIYPYEENFLWNWFCSEGAYFWKYCCISTGYFFAVMLLMSVGAFCQVIRREEQEVVFQCYLAVFGLFAFLLLWEAQNKQLYNHIPWMTLATVYGLERLYQGIQKG